MLKIFESNFQCIENKFAEQKQTIQDNAIKVIEKLTNEIRFKEDNVFSANQPKLSFPVSLSISMLTVLLPVIFSLQMIFNIIWAVLIEIMTLQFQLKRCLKLCRLLKGVPYGPAYIECTIPRDEFNSFKGVGVFD